MQNHYIHRLQGMILTARRLCDGLIRMPTAALVCLEQQASAWDQIRKGRLSLRWSVTPDLLEKLRSSKKINH